MNVILLVRPLKLDRRLERELVKTYGAAYPAWWPKRANHWLWASIDAGLSWTTGSPTHTLPLAVVPTTVEAWIRERENVEPPRFYSWEWQIVKP